MSSKKSRTTQNENLCPTVRKRTLSKASPQKAWKLAKLESTSSPSALTIEDLEEMGIGMLDSEESSSSATSSIALVMSGSVDENSNEPSLSSNTAMFYHQHKFSQVDASLDSSSDNANHGLLDITNETLKASSDSKSSCNSLQLINSSSSSNFDIYTDEQNLKDKETFPFLPQYKKISILGGATSISPQSVNNSRSNSPTGARLTRSPLKAVPTNSQDSNATLVQQHFTVPQHQQIQTQSQTQLQQKNQNGQVMGNSANFTPNTTLQHVLHHQLQQPFNQKQKVAQTNSPYSPSTQPTTSKQAALLQHHQQQIQYQSIQNLHKAQKYNNLLHNQLSFSQLYRSAAKNSEEDAFFFYRKTALQNPDRRDHFSRLSDEIILQIFKWLPKKALIRCGMVNRRFNQCAADESLWTRLDLGGQSLRSGAMENILPRGVVVLRLAQTQLSHPVFYPDFLENHLNFESKLQYLDLSMANITKPSLKMLLAHCRQLKKLSLEHVPVNDEICNEIAKNVNLEALNLGMCTGLEAWSLRKMMANLQNLNSLNISWTGLSVDAVTSLVTNITPNILRLNIAGCRKTMFDSHLASLAKRCQQLLELDLSDCSGLTGNAITIICKFKMLEYLSLSRCYLIPAASYVELSTLSTLTYLDIFGMLSDTALELFQSSFPNLGINKFIHSSVARPTVGTRRTSIWGLRTRD